MQTSIGLLGLALLLLLFADIELQRPDPWGELAAIGWGLLSPDFWHIEQLPQALFNTLAFALLGVALSAPTGLLLALAFHWRWVRTLCAFVRSIHELFWALLLMQLLGLSPLTGVLAIAIPYSGIFAKIFAEILEESDQRAWKLVPPGSDPLSAFCYSRLPQAWPHLRSYTRYRLECALRSSAVLGFIGLPTLGFHLESAFNQGLYSQSAALIYLLIVLVFALRWLFWHPATVPLYCLVAILWLPWSLTFDLGLVWHLLSQELLPAPLREQPWQAQSWLNLYDWGSVLIQQQALPGLFNTLILSIIATVASGLLALLLFPLISSQFLRRRGRSCGHLLLVSMRSVPELILAFVLLLVIGPSMLPAIIALALHNGAIIGHLIGQASDGILLRVDACFGLNRYLFEVLPRIYRQFLAFTLYRWEVILRETAILGILGIQTLGFYIDSAFEELRFDRALLLILVTAFLNMLVDSSARWLRLRLNLSDGPSTLIPTHPTR